MSSQPLIQVQPTSLDHLRQFAEGGYLYAILDATDAPAVPEKVRELGEERAVSLFKGTAQEDYWAVAPYLVKVDSELLNWILQTLGETPWGVFALSKASLQELRLHFRRFLLVTLPDGKPWFFRYYDPRILLSYLPACDSDELDELFRDVRAFVISHLQDIKMLMLSNVRPYNGKERSTTLRGQLLWRVRPDQVTVFQTASLRFFENRMLQHLRKCFESECGEMDDRGLRNLVQYGIARAQFYGFSSERDLRRYIDVMILFGRDFENSTEGEWARQILNEQSIDPDTKMHRFYRAGKTRLGNQIRGKAN